MINLLTYHLQTIWKFSKKKCIFGMKLLLHHHIQYLNTILVPLDFDEFQFVFLFLPLVLGDDDEVGVGALEDVLTKCNIF